MACEFPIHSLGCTGGTVAKTPIIDGLARNGIVYREARNQSPVCTPVRSTILTGQHVRMHGVTSNGIPLPADHQGLAHELKKVGYSTALIGTAHFEPHAAKDFFENLAAGKNSFGPHRGFDYMELSGYTGRAGRSLFHCPKWLAETNPEAVEGFHEYTSGGAPSAKGGGDTGASQVAYNPIRGDGRRALRPCRGPPSVAEPLGRSCTRRDQVRPPRRPPRQPARRPGSAAGEDCPGLKIDTLQGDRCRFLSAFWTGTALYSLWDGKAAWKGLLVDTAPDFTPFERALRSLQAAQSQPPRNDLERDGVIQRFEYTFELCWKSIRRVLLYMGRTDVSGSPRPLFRDALEEHFIQDSG
jgi:hypothetical protein